MPSDVYELVQNFFFVRKTELNFEDCLNAGIDEDAAFKEVVIGQGISSADIFDFSMYLYNCPPKKGGRDMPFEVYFPCSKLTTIFNKEIVNLPSLKPPIEMTFLYKPIISESELNLHHFTLCFHDATNCQYKRNPCSGAQKKFVKKCVVHYLCEVMLQGTNSIILWDKKDDKKLFKCSDVTKRYFRLHRRIWRWCCCNFSKLKSKIKKIICLCWAKTHVSYK